MQIKKATLKELDILVPMFDEYRQFYQQTSDKEKSYTYLKDRIIKNESEIFIALTNDGAGAGFVQLYPAFSSVSMGRIWILNDLFVQKDYRKRGVGNALIEKSFDLCRQTGAVYLQLQTQHSNKTAQSLYEKIGFEPDMENRYYFYSLKRL